MFIPVAKRFLLLSEAEFINFASYRKALLV